MGVIQTAIDNGKAYLDRLYYEKDASNAFMRDYLAPPLWVKVEETGEVINAAESKPDRGRWPTKYSTYLKAPGRGSFPNGASYNDFEVSHCWFATDDGIGMTGPSTVVHLDVMIASHSNQSDVLYYVKMTDYLGPRIVKVYLGATLLFTGNHKGETAELTRSYGMAGVRYVGRHHSRVSQRVYHDLGDAPSLLKATKLQTFMDGLGFTQDVYDPFFGASGGYSDDFFTEEATYPDPDVWPKYPKGEGYTPYRSTLANTVTRDMYIGKNNVRWVPPLLGWFGPLVNAVASDGEAPLGLTIRSSPFYDCAKAMHLLQKYGAGAADEAKEWLGRAGWDGVGTRRDIYLDLPGVPPSPANQTMSPFTRTCYEGYSLPCFLAACCKLYAVNADGQANQWAQEACDVLLKMQWQWNSVQWPSQVKHLGEHIGGFMGSYHATSVRGIQFDTQNGMMHYLRDYASETFIPLHERSYPDYVGFVPCSGEPSSLGVMGLMRYKEVFGDVMPSP